MSKLGMVVPAVVFKFGLEGEPQFTLRALVDGHQPIPPTAAGKSPLPYNCIPIRCVRAGVDPVVKKTRAGGTGGLQHRG